MAAILRISLLTALLSLLGSAPALADRFAPLPGPKKARDGLAIKFVRYDGSTNGKMVVELANTAKTRRTFVAEGLYFVPEGDPEQAPQRLGAAGPFTIVAKKGPAKHESKLALAPGERKTIALEVFCIDSHRSSPNSSTRFRVAKKLLPKQLRQKLGAGTKKILRKNKGDVAKAKPAIQKHMWETRDEKWIPIEGERAAEKAAPQKRRRPQRNAPRRHHREQRRTP